MISFLWAVFFASVLASGAEPVQAPVHWIAIRSTINPATSEFLKESITRAEAAQARALVVELDTPGGLISSVREMAQAVSASKVPVVVYVTPAGASATSAGALLMLSAHVAAMAPGTNIGAAHPVGGQGEEVKGVMGEKILNDTTAFARSLAETHGRNRELAEKVVSKSASFTAEEALKEKLIEVLAPSADELFQKLKLTGAPVQKFEMRFAQKLLNWLANPNLSAILMSLGLLLIYVELQSPGGFLAGIAGAICLIIAFMSLQTLPIHVGGLALLILGTVLMLAEPFVTTKGALAAGGLLSFVLGLLWVIDPTHSDLQVSLYVILPLALGLGSGLALMAWAAARTQALTQKVRAEIGGGKALGLAGYVARVESVEANGHFGKVWIRGELWSFESNQVFTVGETGTVKSAEGMKVHLSKS